MAEGEEYKFEINCNDTKFNFNISYTEQETNIKGKEENNLKEIFEGSFTLSALVEMNNIFKLLSTPKDCYYYLLKIIKNKKIKVSKESSKLIIIFIVKNIITENEEEIKLELNPKILDINKTIDNYIIVLKELKNENVGLKNEISTLKKENIDIKNEISTLKNENVDLKKEISTLKNEYKTFKDNINSIIDEKIKSGKEKENEKKIEKEKEIFYDVNNSSILTTLEEKLYFQNLIKCQNLSLLYRPSEHGTSLKDFHKYCDGRGPTLTVFKNGKNRKFGGYLKASWNNSSDYSYNKDNEHFLFSLDLKKKYKIKNNINYAFISYNGPLFRGLGINNCNNENILQVPNFYEEDLKKKDYEVDEGYQLYEISGGERISCKDLEVYLIES